jgi:TolA-binding protein
MRDEAVSLRSLGERIAHEQDTLFAGSVSRDTAGARILDSLTKKPRSALSRTAPWLLAAAAALGTAMFVVGWLEYSAPITMHVGDDGRAQPVGAWVSAPVARQLPLRFSDGTSIVLGPRSRARVVATNQKGAHVVVESGSAHIKVVPQPAADWQMHFGPFVVEVVGTEFAVHWNPDEDRFSIALATGRVKVSGCVLGEGRLLLPGDTLTASCRNARFEISSGSQQSTAMPKSSRPSSEPAVPARDKAEPAAPARPAGREARRSDGIATAPAWQTLARQNDYYAAFARASESGFEAECDRGTAADLLLLGDVARLAGNPSKASYAYRHLRRRFPSSGPAAQAAFALARLAFDQRAAYAEASRWFETYLAEQPSGAFSREALGRLMESLHRSGNTGRTHQTAARYLERYPTGPHAALARQLIETK